MLTLLPTNYLNPKDWVEEYADSLYGFAIARIKDEEIARDLVQETFLAGLEGLSTFEGRSSEKTWLTAILKNKIKDLTRKQSRQGVHLPIGIAERWPRLLGPDYQDSLHNKELNKIIENYIKNLPPLPALVFKMKYWEEADAHTICEKLQISRSNYWVILHRTKLSLRRFVQKSWS